MLIYGLVDPRRRAALKRRQSPVSKGAPVVAFQNSRMLFLSSFLPPQQCLGRLFAVAGTSAFTRP